MFRPGTTVIYRAWALADVYLLFAEVEENSPLSLIFNRVLLSEVGGQVADLVVFPTKATVWHPKN